VAPPIETLPVRSRKAPGAFSITSPKLRPIGTLVLKDESNVGPSRVEPTSIAGALRWMT
jgi:hypothetical protein